MKSKPEFETTFEETLAEFEMRPLPGEWKSELINNAVLEAAGEQKTASFSRFTKIVVGALAACWVAIGLLHFTTPSNTDFADTGMAEPVDLSLEDLPIVAAYFVRIGVSDFNY